MMHLLCAGEVTAMTTMACMSDHGLIVGEDADIVAKQTSTLFDHVRPKVDTIIEDIAFASEKMGELLVGRISGGTAEQSGHIQMPSPRFFD